MPGVCTIAVVCGAAEAASMENARGGGTASVTGWRAKVSLGAILPALLRKLPSDRLVYCCTAANVTFEVRVYGTAFLLKTLCCDGVSVLASE